MNDRIIVQGKGGISAEIIADSINIFGDRLTTFQLHYHRYIHSEFMTHRMFSRNASSSRAIPVKSMLEKIRDEPATPIHWGKNQGGMQADQEQDEAIYIEDYYDYLIKQGFSSELADAKAYVSPKPAWKMFADKAACHARTMNASGYHKQIVNRLTEPFQFMNVVCSATDYDNFFFLRCHPDAQPEIQELAECMYRAREQSVPEELREGQWHTPYVDHVRTYDTGEFTYVDENRVRITLENALKISASCCAQVSYRKNDTSLEKAISIYDRLIGMSPLHASPFEHMATPFSEVEHISRTTSEMSLSTCGIKNTGVQYCGNFRGWRQLRKTLKDENITHFEK